MHALLRLLVLITFIAGIVGAFVPFVVPGVAESMDDFICPGIDTVALRHEPADDGGTSISFECVDLEGIHHEAGLMPYLVLFTAWLWLPLIPVLLLLLTGGRLFPKSNTLVTIPGGTYRTVSFGANQPGSLSLVDRLRQLEEALSAGLITQAEYDKTKQDILNRFNK